MTVKRFSLVLALLALLAAGVSAGDATAPKGFAVMGYWHSGPEALLYDPVVHEATGLEMEELRAALLEGKTISELIEANQGDVDAAIAELLAQASDAINAHAATAIEGLDENIADALNDRIRQRFPWWRRLNPVRELFGAWGMDEAIREATGLETSALNASLLDGSTIAELIEANDGDAQALASTLVGQATEEINAAAAARIERYEEAVAEVFETDFSEESGRRWQQRPRQRGFFGFWRYSDSATTSNVEADAG